MEFSDDIFFRNFNPACHHGGFFSIDAGEDRSIARSKFTQNKFYYIKSGKCELVIEGKNMKVSPEDGFTFPPVSVTTTLMTRVSLSVNTGCTSIFIPIR